jgi:ABC-type nitrate/sulfonate/bicarbonate transport system ATPase subunit
MLTKLTIRNFKRFEHAEIPLSSPVVFIGPNNSGKTTALQALALWELGLRRWREKRSDKSAPEKRPGVAINRRDLLAVPAPSANLLWRDLHVRNVQKKDGKQETQNIRIDVIVDGESKGAPWACGLEFDFSNDESFFCRPLRLEDSRSPSRMTIPNEAFEVDVAFLPPMSGLVANETSLDRGAINVRLGEGRTAEVLRNICFQLYDSREWTRIKSRIQEFFGVTLDDPEYIAERGELRMSYVDATGSRLDISSSGRGLQQTLLLFAYLEMNPGAVLLLDEPDAHLEILRQRDIFRLLHETARDNGSQLIIASHSEEVLNQAAQLNPDSVVAFLGQPHRVAAGKTDAVRKALTAVRFDQYYLAEQRGWVLYIEGATDLSVLQAFAARLKHKSQVALQSPFVFPIGNQPNLAREHFNALLEAKPDLVGFLLVDQDAKDLQERDQLQEWKWARREIENYLCQPTALEAFAAQFGMESASGPLFEGAEAEKAVLAMRESIQELVPPIALRDPNDNWWRTVKATDEFLDRLFPAFYERLNLTLAFRKADYYRLARFIPDDLIDPEIVQVLDRIAATAEKANPAR